MNTCFLKERPADRFFAKKQEYGKLAGIKFWDAVITDDDPQNAIQELRSIVCRMCFVSD